MTGLQRRSRWRWGWVAVLWPVWSLQAEPPLTEAYQLMVGGRLYDNWYKSLKGTPPKSAHPAYPAGGKQSGAATWRCKSCHGWNYQGEAGITGIQAFRGRDPQEVVAKLRQAPHGYGPDLIPEEAMKALALWVVKGPREMASIVEATTGKSLGDPGRGAPHYQTICAHCHGLDGRKINFGSPKEPEYLADVSHDNPYEMLHKIRHGQPGEPMVSLITQPDQVAADIIAYVQSWPTKPRK